MTGSSSRFSSTATELQASMQFDVGFTAVAILHPATYINKVLVSSNEGSLQLWNIRTQYASATSYILRSVDHYSGLEFTHFLRHPY